MPDTVSHAGEDIYGHKLSHVPAPGRKPLMYRVQVRDKTPHGLIPIEVSADHHMADPPRPVLEAAELMAPGHYRLKRAEPARGMGRTLMLFEKA